MAFIEDDERPPVTPLQFLTAVYMNEGAPLPTRIKAAIEATQYVHPKLAMLAVSHGREDFGVQLERAVSRSNEAHLEHQRVKVIEGKPITPSHASAAEVSSARMSQGFAPLRRRF
jgi:hypothetical protein